MTAIENHVFFLRINRNKLQNQEWVDLQLFKTCTVILSYSGFAANSGVDTKRTKSQMEFMYPSKKIIPDTSEEIFLSEPIQHPNPCHEINFGLSKTK